MPDPIPDETIDRELRYASALGLVVAWSGQLASNRNRRFLVKTHDGEIYDWSPGQVMAFATGVRLATERKG